MTSEEISLLDTGACGAFVHGLEDEFEEVRLAAIGAWLHVIGWNIKCIYRVDVGTCDAAW